MIYSNLKYVDLEKLDPKMKAVFEYLEANDLKNFEEGSYKIIGNDVFVNRANIKTVDRNTKGWEAHRKYLDVHVVLDGIEVIDVAFIDDMEIIKYHEDSDFVECSGEKKQSIVLTKGEFLIVNPEDAHKPCVSLDKDTVVEKAIFKVIV